MALVLDTRTMAQRGRDFLKTADALDIVYLPVNQAYAVVWGSGMHILRLFNHKIDALEWVGETYTTAEDIR